MPLMAPVCGVAVILLITPGLLFYFDITPKAALLLIGTALLLIPAVRRVPGLWKQREGRWFLVLLAAQFASLVWSTALSADPALSFGGSNWRRMGVVSHCALLLFALSAAAFIAEDSRRLLITLRALSLGGIVAAAYGCAQYAGWDPLLPSARYHIGEGEWTIVRPPGTLGHAAYAATFYLHAAFAGLALVVADEAPWRRAGIVTAALCAAAIVLSGTRAAILGGCAGAVLMLLATRPKLRAVHAAGAAVVILAGTAFYFAPAGQKLRSRTRWYVEDPRGGARLWLWRDSAVMGASRWLSGWGPEVFPAEFPRFESKELARAFPDYYHESPHNVLLEAWTSQGLPGLAIMAGLSGVALAQFRRSRLTATLCAGLAAALVAQQFTSFTLATALCFYWMLALIIPSRASFGLRRASAVPWTLPVSLALLVYAAALLAADRQQLQSSRLLAAGRLTEGIAAFDQARKWQPPGVNSDLWFSRTLFDAARRSPQVIEAASSMRVAAEAATRAAAHAEDRANAAYNLAAIQAVLGNSAEVEASLRLAIRLAPHWYKPHWTLAKLLALSGRRAEARAESELAAGLGGGIHPEVQQTRQELRSQE